MLESLAAAGPHPDHADELMLFGQFVGEWDVDADHPGEWIFGWVLEGRAVQDVLISPPRAGRANGDRSYEYGSTMRFYDPETGRWEITWITPLDRRVERLSGGRVGDDIVLEGRSSRTGDRIRWSFEDIRPGSFTWRGRRSTDDGATWTLVEEMRLRRRPDA